MIVESEEDPLLSSFDTTPNKHDRTSQEKERKPYTGSGVTRRSHYLDRRLVYRCLMFIPVIISALIYDNHTRERHIK